MTDSRPVSVDLHGVRTAAEMHERLKSAFGFLSYYGENWDAFWDCVTESNPEKIHIRGISWLSTNLPREAALLEKSLADLHATSERGNIEIQFE